MMLGASIAGMSLALAGMAGTWASYGGDPGGQKYSDANHVTPQNVAELKQAWVFRTGERGEGFAVKDKLTFQATPVLLDGTLYFSTATGRVFAIDAAKGTLRWRFDAHLDPSAYYSEKSARGVSIWIDTAAAADTPCAKRVIFASLDARLFAIDAITGKTCAGFGEGGEVPLYRGVRLRNRSDYNVTSPPVIIGDTIVVGSSIGDNRATNIELGVVRAYGARNGELRWHWDPIPRTAKFPAQSNDADFAEVEAQAAQWTGAANAWAPLSVDRQRGLVFVPTGSASPDFFGGQRPGDNRWANSVVALNASDGQMVWGQQFVHHDLWDYDTPAQPVAATVQRNGVARAAIIQATKMGQIFVFDRATGEPIFPIQERRVPQGVVEGESASPTQPFSSLPPLVSHAPVKPADAWGFTPWDRGQCEQKIAALRSEGIYTPPSIQGTILRPGYGGGSNWGGIAFDPSRQLVIANVMDLAMVVTLIPRANLRSMADSGAYPQSEFARQEGTPYGMRRELLTSNIGVPCTSPPWGKLVALSMRTGKIHWQRPLGTSRDIAPWPIWGIQGVPNMGGPIATAGGLIFIGATADNFIRAFSTDTGEELWKQRLPAGGQATPMTYVLGGKQYIVIAAGGHGGMGTTLGDYLMAYALPGKR
jgi:quinoprotein glucose dehydrogenase